MTKSDRKKIKQYFQKFKVWQFIAFPVNVFYLYRYFNKPGHEGFDELFDEAMVSLKRVALENLRITEDQLVAETVMIKSPVYEKIPHVFQGFRRGKDRMIRHTPIAVAVIFFTEHKLCIYQCLFDLTTGNLLKVYTRKYFYDDVVSVETESSPIIMDEKDIKKDTFKYLPDLKHHIVDGKLQINESKQFVLTTKGGNSVKIQLPDVAILDSVMGERNNAHSYSDDAIASVEAMLDSKKASC